MHVFLQLCMYLCVYVCIVSLCVYVYIYIVCLNLYRLRISVCVCVSIYILCIDYICMCVSVSCMYSRLTVCACVHYVSMWVGVKVKWINPLLRFLVTSSLSPPHPHPTPFTLLRTIKPACLSFNLSVCLSAFLFAKLHSSHISLPLCVSVRLFAFLYVCISVCLLSCLSVCFLVCLYVSFLTSTRLGFLLVYPSAYPLHLSPLFLFFLHLIHPNLILSPSNRIHPPLSNSSYFKTSNFLPPSLLFHFGCFTIIIIFSSSGVTHSLTDHRSPLPSTHSLSLLGYVTA